MIRLKRGFGLVFCERTSLAKGRFVGKVIIFSKRFNDESHRQVDIHRPRTAMETAIMTTRIAS